jgi:predicted amidophosphoribosyltransferase
MSQSLECPRCHLRCETRGSGWQSRSCKNCGAPLVLAAVPAERLVRKYLYGDRLAALGSLPPGATGGPRSA